MKKIVKGCFCLVSVLAAGIVRASVPFDGLAAAVDAAADGAVIELDEGEYTISAELVVEKPLTIRGAGVGRTVIKTATDIKSRMISITVSGAVMENLTIQGRSLTCRSVTGKGVYLSDGTLRNCRVTGFSSGQYWSSGAVAVSGANALVENCVIDGNTTVKGNDQLEKGGGVYLTAGTVRGCTITNNTSNSGGGVYMTGGTLENSLVAYNKLQYMDRNNTTMGTGGGVWNSNGKIAGCTIVFNSASDYMGIGGLYLDGTGGTVERTIVRFNTSCNSSYVLAPDVHCSDDAVESKVSNCCLPVPFGVDCVTDLPMFADAANNDYSILAGSPCILADGVVIGCCPYASATPTVGFSVDRDAVLVGSNITFTARVSNSTGGEASYSWRFYNNHGFSETASGTTVTRSFAEAGAYSVELTATGGGASEPCVRTDCIAVRPAVVEAADVAALETAVAEAVDGQTVRLTGTTYALNKTIRLFKAVTLEGANGWKNCVLDIAGRGRAIILSNPGAVVRGVTAMGGKLPAYGIANPTSDNITGLTVWIAARGGTLCDSRVTGGTCGNHYQQGHLGVTGAKGHVMRCVIDNNNSLWQKESGNGWGGGVYMVNGLVENCVISNNFSFTGGGAYVAGGTLRNCTFYKNQAERSGGIHADGGLVVNCVSMGSTITMTKDSTSGRPEWGGTDSCFANCAFVDVAAAPGSTSMVLTDPFENSTAWNLHPLPGSEGLVDKGLDYDGAADDTDLDGNPRRSGKRVDIGCYELDASKFNCSIMSPSKTELFSDETVTFFAELINPPAGESFAYDWTFTDGFGTVTEAHDASPVMSLPVGWYTVGLTVSVVGDPSRAVTAPPRAKLVHVAARNLYAVKGNAGAAYPYDTPEKGSEDISQLVSEAISGATIHIGAGTFTVNDEMILSAPITITGEGWADTVLAFKSGVKKRMLRLDNAEAVVEKLTLKGGNLNIRSDQGEGYGIAVWITSKGGTLRDCRVTGAKSDNHYQYGVVAVCGSSGHVTRCLIDGNDNLFQTSSGNGYGILHVSAGLAENCLVTNNNAFTGGGAYVTGGTLRNCTFYKNTARVSGGAKATGGKIVNCVFMSDTSNSSADTTSGRPEWSGTGSCFENCAFVDLDTLPGNSIKVSDPFIASGAGDLHPAAGSAGLADKGQDWEGVEDDLDFDGKPRKSGSSVDIGCYEVDATLFSCSFDAADGKVEGFIDEDFGLVSDIVNPPDGVKFGYDWTLTDRFGKVIKSNDANPTLRLPGGWYSVEMSVYNVDNPAQRAAASPRVDFLHVCARDLYATAGNANAAYPWATPETGSTNVNELVTEAIGGCVVHIGEGTFTNRAEMVVNKAVTITGEGWEKSVIRILGSANRRVLCLDHEGAVCEKVTLCGSRNNLHGGNDDGYGTGVRIASAGGELRDCRVTDNQAMNYYQFGAGVSVRSSKGVVRRCIIDNNSNLYRETVQHGGGIDVTAGLVENCLVVSNTSGEGAGISLSGGTIRNCTVAFNKALKCWETAPGGTYMGGYSGGVRLNGGGKLQNCVFYGNTAETNMWYNNDPTVKAWQPVVGYPEWLGSGTAVKNCGFADTVTTNATTGGSCVLFADPGFCDAVGGDFHLLRTSPLVNAGDRLDYTKDDVDLDGNGRITGFNTRKRTKCLPDLGCYETPWGVPGMVLLVR